MRCNCPAGSKNWSRRLTEVIATLRNEGMSIILSESDDSHSADLVDRVYRIERGVVTAG